MSCLSYLAWSLFYLIRNEVQLKEDQPLDIRIIKYIVQIFLRIAFRDVTIYRSHGHFQ
jgi:hypothetical protein